jgi:Flp pilus assembly pilin Flp
VDGPLNGNQYKDVISIPPLCLFLRCLLGRATREESGQGLTEYAFILLFVAVVATASLTLLGTDISSVLSQLGEAL